MDGDQYRAMIKKLGLNQVSAAKWLGVSLRTSQNYALGLTEIPEPTAKLLRLVVRLRMTPEKATKLMQ